MTYFRPEIEAMSGYTPGEQPQVGKFIKLNTNENPYPPSPAIQQAIQEAARTSLLRYPDPLATAFRRRAAEVFDIDPECILCGNGSDDILTVVTRALVGSGQRLRFPYPSYILYATLAQIQGSQFDEIPFTSNWKLGDDFVAPSADLRLAIVPNPNSPTGTWIAPAEMGELAERLCCPLLVDEAYVDFSDGHCIPLVASQERILVSRTLSKSYALAGLRFGFLVAQPQLIAQFRKVKDSYNCDALSIAAATAAIDDQAWLAENRSRIVATRQRMTSELRQLGFAVIDSQANFVWCEHPERDAGELYERLKAERILVRYMKYPRWRDGLRISVGTDDQIDACLALLKTMV